MPDLTVKYFTSTMEGAPQVSNNWGDLTAFLDACLINGFNLKAINTLTSANGIATATISAGHAYQPFQIVEIAGAVQPEYNGQFRILTTTVNTFTFAVSGSPVTPATTATSLTVKVAPLGWEKPFSGTHRGAYRSKNVQSPQNMLLVDNSLKSPGYNTTWAKWANVGIVEDLVDLDTIVGAQAPFDPNSPTQNWKQVTANQWGWYKWYHGRNAYYETNYGDSGSGSRNWVLIGDDRFFYFFTTYAPGFTWYGRVGYCFGDIISFKPGDAYATALCAEDSLSSNNYFSYAGQYNGYGLIMSLNFDGKVLLRNHTQLGHPVRFGVTSLNTNNGQQVSGRGPVPFPNGADYSLWLQPTYVRQEDGHFRGMMPGMFWMPQSLPYPDLTIVDNVLGQPGRSFVLVRSTYGGETFGAQIGFDITGPWR